MMRKPNWVRPRTWSRIQYYIIAVLFACFLLADFLSRSTIGHHRLVLSENQAKILSPREAAANSTLGFEKLLAISSKPSWRTRGLQKAANLTGLEFSIPTQPHNPDELVRAFEHIGSDHGGTSPPHGSAMAWFAHLDMIKFVVASGFSTALLVEDDVDWDVEILNQMRLVSDNLRNFTGASDIDPNPYGSGWDVLWLGHCGSVIDKEKPILVYPDETRCPNELWLGFGKDELRDNVPEGYRAVHEVTIRAVCTYAYGITAESGQKILELMARGDGSAYDLQLSYYCATGDLRCIVANPQVMNHYEPPLSLGYVSPTRQGDGHGTSADDSQFEHLKGTTRDIVNSTRCKALFDDVCMPPPED